MKARGDADGDHPAGDGKILPQLGQGHAEVAALPFQPAVDQDDGAQLGEHSGHRRADDPHGQQADTDQIHHDIHAAGDDQDAEGGLRVADGPDDACADVIDGGEHQPGQIDAQIGQGVPEDLRLRPGDPQQQRGAQDAQQGHQNAEDHGKGKGHPHGAQQLFPVVQAEGLGHHHGGAHGHAVEKAHHQVGGPHADAHRGKGLLAYKIAHHDGVCAVIKVLQQLPHDDGNGEQQKLLDDIPAAEVDPLAFQTNASL